MKTEIINVLVIGTGGQGVVWLSNQIRKLSKTNGYYCVGATFKGGAQKMGTVYSELRLVSNASQIISSQIPNGKVDVLIALEPWEALRFINKCHSNTKAIINKNIERLYVERQQNTTINPIDELNRNLKRIEWITPTKNLKINQFILDKIITLNLLPFKKSTYEKRK